MDFELKCFTRMKNKARMINEQIEDKICKRIGCITKIIYIMLFVILFLLYYTCPFYSDDLLYMNCWESELPLAGLEDVLHYQYMHYMEWGGRTVAHTILQVLFLLGKPISAFLNAICHMCLAYMILKFTAEKVNIFIYSEVIALLYFLNPEFNETMLWYTGNANYMWTTLLILIASYPFFKMQENNKSSKQKYNFIIAFLAGWTNENMATTMILFMIVCTILDYSKSKKINIKAVVSIICAGIGCIFMLGAPGNYVRASVLPSGIMGIMYRGHGQVNSWCNWLLPSWVLLFVLVSIGWKVVSETQRKKLVLIIGWAIVSALIMVCSPSYPVRATFGTFVLLLIAIQSIMNEIQNRQIITKRTQVDILLFIGWIGSMASIVILAYVRSMGVYIPG